MQMKPQELIKAIVAGVGELIKADNETLKTVLLAEIKAVREENKKEHTEIMEKMTKSNEIQGKQIKRLDERVSQLDQHTELPHSH